MIGRSIIKKILCASLVATQVFVMSFTTKAVAATHNDDYKWRVFSFQDEEELKANIISNDMFIFDWAHVADMLGFAWCGGTNYERIGEGFDFERGTENGKPVYYLKSHYNSTDSYAEGYRANERLEMKVSNVRFVMDPSDLEFKKAKITELKPEIDASTYATNEGNSEDTVGITVNDTKIKTVTKTDNFKFGEKIGIKGSVKVGIPFLLENKLETSFETSAEQGWSKAEGNTKTDIVITQYNAKVPAHSRRYVELVKFKKKSEVPYSAKIYMEYDITFNGFLRWSGNARKDHPEDRPTVSVTLGGKNNMSATEHLSDLYKHRNIPGYSEWDWKWMKETYDERCGEGYVENLVNDVTGIRNGGVITGVFTGIDGTHSDIKACEAEPLDKNPAHNVPVEKNNSKLKVNSTKK